jgi:hypothetical protein
LLREEIMDARAYQEWKASATEQSRRRAQSEADFRARAAAAADGSGSAVLDSSVLSDGPASGVSALDGPASGVSALADVTLEEDPTAQEAAPTQEAAAPEPPEVKQGCACAVQ